MRFLRRTLLATPLVAVAAIVLGLPSMALGRVDRGDFSARLNGLNENPPINTRGTGTLKLELREEAIDFELRYENLTLAPNVAHIHFAPVRVNGGVVVFFCGGGGQPACPTTPSGTIRGTATAANVVALPAQGVAAMDLDAVKRAIRIGYAYANVHTPAPNGFPGGEIRGQIVERDFRPLRLFDTD
jgi:hypothetical protein